MFESVDVLPRPRTSGEVSIWGMEGIKAESLSMEEHKNVLC